MSKTRHIPINAKVGFQAIFLPRNPAQQTVAPWSQIKKIMKIADSNYERSHQSYNIFIDGVHATSTHLVINYKKYIINIQYN